MINNILVVGNHDTVTLFGMEEQEELRNVTKNIAEILTRDDLHVEETLKNLNLEIDKFQLESDRGKFVSLINRKHRVKALKEIYNVMLAYMDKITLTLQLQQAQLLKDTSVLEKMDSILQDCIVCIEKDIHTGEKTLLEVQGRKDAIQLEEWTNRLKMKLNDMEISKTVSQQSRAQLQLMCSNNRKLIDKIVFTISNTLPIWRTQVGLLIGIDKTNQITSVQGKIDQISGQYIKEVSRKLHKEAEKTDKKKINYDKVNAMNEQLREALRELENIEIKEQSTRIELLKIFK